jgi:hypothetical protein
LGDKKVQALAVRARIETPDDIQLVHHLVVSGILPFQTSIAGAAPSGPGDVKQCDNPSGGTINVWAPGSFNPLSYPSDVGVLLPSGDDAYLEMQVHYNNPDMQTGKKSRVQYDLCVTSKMRPQTAAVFWLGYENAFADTLLSGKETTSRLDNQNNGTAIGKCAAKTKARILNIMPHMHEQGRHGKVEVVRKSGMTELVLDKPFDFRDQTSYFNDNLWLEPGDVVRSTCTWDKGPVHFGFASDSEMCFFYTLAYPVEAFAPSDSEKGFIGSSGNQACAASAGP